MAKHRITLVRDDSAVYGTYTNEEWINERRDGLVHGFSIERTEKLPDPPIVKKFEVEVTFPPSCPPDESDYRQIVADMVIDPYNADGPSVLASNGRTVKVREV